ncbi:hypothetical protein RDABS01_025889 [Bienertia sinuspersici]
MVLKSSGSKSAARHRNKRRGQVSLPLSAGSDYTLSLSLNSQTVSVYMDTGSDMVWFPCSPFECILCEGKDRVKDCLPLNVSKVTLQSCKSRACSAAHSSLPSSDLCAIARCPLDQIETSDCSGYDCPSFYYAYGDGSLIAQLHMNNLLLPATSYGNGNGKSLIVENFTFGCAHSTLGEPIGVAGFGRGSLSLPAQLGPELGNQFSYCLVSHSFDSTKLRHPSPLILGKSKKTQPENDIADEVSKYVYTPLLENPKHPYFYSVGLEAISVGNRRIPAPKKLLAIDGEGNGGVVVDSGTTYTMLPTGLYKSVTAELKKQVGKRHLAADTQSRTGLSPCFRWRTAMVLPTLVLHLGRNSSVVLPQSNYFHHFIDEYEYDDGNMNRRMKMKVVCFMMMDGGDESGPGATLGNYQQQGFHVIYDLSEGWVGFAPRQCETLWNDLNRH